MGEWTKGSIGDFFDLDPGYAFKSSDFVDSGVPVIKIKNVKAGHFSEHEFSYVPLRFLTLRAAKLAKPGDLLISMSGNRHDGSPETWVGKIAPFQKAGAYFINQRVGALRRKLGSNIDLRFARFLLSSLPYQELFIAIATSSGGQANLSPLQILSAPLSCPPLKTQCAIGEILGALDDKIGLNRRMNETLETMARAIFKDWFVDFGPTRANMERHAPYLSPDVWSLFPGRLDDEGKPDGWKMAPFSETVQIIGGGTPKTAVDAYWNGDIPWFSVVDAPNPGQVWVVATEKCISVEGLYASSARLLPVGTTIISARGTVGRIALVGLPMAMNQSCYGLSSRIGSDSFTYFSTQAVVSDLQQQAHGSVFDTITRDTFSGISVVIPQEEVVRSFDECVRLGLERSRHNAFENSTIATTRDLLLPKLMSGEIRVKDAEKMVETVL